MTMKTLIKIEELFLVILSFYLFLNLHYAWWWFLILFFAPDLSMIGYLINPRVGALKYDFVHHKGTAVALFILGSFLHLEWTQAAGLIILGHSSFDRILGYGLKYSDAFQHTHLGMIGRNPTA
ncbi:MAG: DUF4260 domain-containing protein [Anaerolineales bacterium]